MGSDLKIAIDGQRRTAHELVRDSLRGSILRGRIPGGTRLVQAAIANKLHVSTTPVREALRDLAAEGIIRLDAHRGAIVQELGLDDLREIYDLRAILEPEAMRRAATAITGDELLAADELQRRMDSEHDTAVWAGLNGQFHGLLVRGSRSPRLVAILTNLHDHAAPYVTLSLRVQSDQLRAGNADHHELLNALRIRDAETAATIVDHHLRSTIALIEAAVNQAPVIGARGGLTGI